MALVGRVQDSKERLKNIRGEFAELCRQFGAQALATQAEIMNNPKASESARLRASSLIMAYGYGQPTNNVSVDVNADKGGGETPEQKKFRETMENATRTAAQSMRQAPALAKPDPVKDGASPLTEVYSPTQLTPAERELATVGPDPATQAPDSESLALGVALGSQL